MGRLAYLTGLALGRHSFGDVLRDEQGNALVGPRSQDNTASGYVQAFDYKGRPTNDETERTNRRFFRAQNEVLRVAGVVRKKNEGGGAAAVNPFDGLDENDKLKLIGYECNLGARLGYFTGIFCQMSDWWLESWRSRVFVFKSHLEPPILTTIVAERRVHGLLPFLFSGLPWTMCAGSLNLVRHWTLYAALPPLRRGSQGTRGRYENYKTALPLLAQRYLLDLFLFSFEWPFRVFSALQSVHLLSLSAVPSWWSFIPGMVESPIQFSGLIGRIMAGDVVGAVVALSSNPFILAYISDLVRESLALGFHTVLSSCLPQPNEPDALSREAIIRGCADEELPPGRDRLIGVRLGIDPVYYRIPDDKLAHGFRRQYKGPQTVVGALRSAFPNLFRLVGHFVEIDPLAGTGLDQNLRSKLHRLYTLRYILLKNLHHHLAEVDELQIRQEAALQAFHKLGLDMLELGIDVEWWITMLALPVPDGFTTPTPEILPVIEGRSEIAGPVRSTASSLVEEAGAAGGQQREQAPVETSDAARRAGSVEAVEEIATLHGLNGAELTVAGTEAESTAGRQLQTLLESIEREEVAAAAAAATEADDMAQDASSPTAILPPGVRMRQRRPTELDEDTTDIAMELRSTPRNSTAAHRQGLQTYRVTHLSLMSTEVFSIFTSSIITSILMLPLDIYVTRLLVRGFALAVPDGTGAGILSNLWPASPWAAAMEMGLEGCNRFYTRVYWSFGVQAVMAATMSAGLARVARWSGRRWFGWASRNASNTRE